MTITQIQLQEYTRFYRANLINCLSGCKPAVMIGSINAQGQTNLGLFSSVVHLGANPALLGYIQRPLGEAGDTFRNIIETGFYTINYFQEAHLQQAHYTSARFETGISEFEKCNFTPQFLKDFKAPFVQESPLQIGLKFVEAVPIKHNDTKLIIGEIMQIHIADNALEPDGNINFNALTTVNVVGLENYYSNNFLEKMPYAKVENLPNFK